MTEISMAFLELLRKHGLDNDVDFLREGFRRFELAAVPGTPFDFAQDMLYAQPVSPHP
jgi:hypothetical protein